MGDEAGEGTGHSCPQEDLGGGEAGSQALVQEQACLFLGFQSKTLTELEDIFTETAEAQELASGIGDAAEARQWLRTKLQAVVEKAGFPGVLGEALGKEGCTFPDACSALTVSSPGWPASSVPVIQGPPIP